jgi:hypothetical protein
LSLPQGLVFLKKYLAFFLPLVLLPCRTFAASDYSITFEEFKKKLEGVFSEDQFTSLRSFLPQDFEIWGYDVGDFSGDDEPDVAISVKPIDLKGKKVRVFFFINDGPSFIEASTLQVGYFEIPIEVGFTVEHEVCFMTSKEKDHHWFITGYAFHNGSFILVDRFEVGRHFIGVANHTEIGYEEYNNYETLASRQSFFNVSNGKLFLGAQYYTFPVYRMGRRPLPDFVTSLKDTSGKYFVVGKENWTGPQDLGFSASAVYEDSALYCHLRVIDDSLVVGAGDMADGDCTNLWFDLKASRMNPSSGTAPNFRLQPDSGVMSMSISPGDFRTKRPRVAVLLHKQPSDLQRQGINSISVTSTKRADGYELLARIPFSLFDLEKPPSVMGFTAEVNDVDGSNGDLKRTRMATSELRDWDPSTFGVLRFIPEYGSYGEVRNLSIENLLQCLRDVGI